MSINITTAFVEQYRNNIELLVQQLASRLRGNVSEETVTGKSAFFEQVGVVEAQDVVSRHSDSPLANTPHARRRVTLVTKEIGDLVDDEDKVRMLIDPTSSYARVQAAALGRAIDSAIITAATGSADTGVDGSTSTALPTASKVAVDYVESGSAANSGLTVAKLRQARQQLAEQEAITQGQKVCIVVAAQQVHDLLTDEEVTSSDYNTVKALVNGEINTYMGFDFVRTELTALNTSTDVRTCFAFTDDGLMLAIGRNPTVEIARRPDKRFSTYVYSAMDIGATRMQEEKVVQILCDESP